MTTPSPRYVSHDELASLSITAHEVVASIRDLLKARERGEAWSAPKSAIQVPDGRYVMSTMALAQDPPYIAVKSLALNPDNPRHGLELMNALVTLLDARTGIPVAVLDGNWITAIRTAGLSGVAAVELARPDASCIAFVGCGVQARAHLKLFRELFPLTQVRALGRGASNRDRLCELARSYGLTVSPCSSAEEVLDGADIIVTSVTHDLSMRPFIDAHAVAPGAFAAVTDLARPWRRESLAAFDRIIIDDIEQEQRMQHPMLDSVPIAGDIQGLVTAKVAPRCDAKERAAFVFRGMAVGDLALAALAWQRLQQHSEAH